MVTTHENALFHDDVGPLLQRRSKSRLKDLGIDQKPIPERLCSCIFRGAPLLIGTHSPFSGHPLLSLAQNGPRSRIFQGALHKMEDEPCTAIKEAKPHKVSVNPVGYR